MGLGLFAALAASTLFPGCDLETQGRPENTLAGSCEGFCGEMAPLGCYCDADCAADGDCCPDAALACASVAANEDDPWIGSPCNPGEDACDFEANGARAECMAFDDGDGVTHGFCSVPCAGTCPDSDGHATTFCVEHEGGGQCMSKASATYNENCEELPGTRAKSKSRYVGGSGISSSSASVCVPDQRSAVTGELAADLLELTSDCDRLDGTQLFRTDAGRARTIEICELEGAIWWRADADIDCDGGRSEPCTSDPWYQATTSSKDSTGNFIDSAAVPHFVVPMSGSGFTPSDHGIRTSWSAVGSAGAILYDGQLLFAPYADAGPRHVVGELSAAAADELGIPNHPVSGGVAEGVTYIIFTGDDAYVSPIESRAAAESIGEELAQRLIENN
ncbi:MAG: glycoside hydrolase family 75 protein [Nannocystales bacterium]